MIGKEGVESGKPGSEVRFFGTGKEPEVMGFVIDKDTEIAVLSKGGDIHRPTDIRVQLTELFRSDIVPSLEGSMYHLPFNASHAVKTLCIISDIRDPICERFSDHELESVFSRVHEAFVEEVKGGSSGKGSSGIRGWGGVRCSVEVVKSSRVLQRFCNYGAIAVGDLAHTISETYAESMVVESLAREKAVCEPGHKLDAPELAGDVCTIYQTLQGYDPFSKRGCCYHFPVEHCEAHHTVYTR